MNINWVLTGILLCGFVIGWRKGLFRIVSGLVGLVIGLYAAFHFNAAMGAFIDQHTGFRAWMAGFLTAHLPVAELAAAFPVAFLPGSTAEAAGKFVAAPGEAIAGLLLNIISFLVLFFLTKLFFRLITRFLTRCLDQTLLGPVNRFLGGVAGAFFVALLIGVSLLGLSGVFGDKELPGSHGESISYQIQKSDLANFLQDLF